eukprot:scaffold82613_cov20-Prasinocladus_malaysianus.AAC.1
MGTYHIASYTGQVVALHWQRASKDPGRPETHQATMETPKTTSYIVCRKKNQPNDNPNYQTAYICSLPNGSQAANHRTRDTTRAYDHQRPEWGVKAPVHYTSKNVR